jgi:hypothetical protein
MSCTRNQLDINTIRYVLNEKGTCNIYIWLRVQRIFENEKNRKF